MKDYDFNKAVQHLHECEQAYLSLGTAGYFVMIHMIRPLRVRVENGDKSKELYQDIMSLDL
jgi:hypothetical protein